MGQGASTVAGPIGAQGLPGKDSTVPGPQGLPGKDSTVPGPQGLPGKLSGWGELSDADKQSFLSRISSDMDFRKNTLTSLQTDLNFRTTLIDALKSDVDFRTALSVLTLGDAAFRQTILNALKTDVAFKGPKGDQGLVGPQGASGAPGIAGVAGSNGINGTNGTNATPDSINTQIKANSMWCADGTTCTVPDGKIIRTNSEFAIGGEPSFIVDDVNIRGGRFSIIGKTVTVANGKLVVNNEGISTNTDGKTRINNAFSMGGDKEFAIDAPGVVGGRFAVATNGIVSVGKMLCIGNSYCLCKNPGNSNLGICNAAGGYQRDF